MAGSSDRLVRRVQRRITSFRTVSPGAADVATLESRAWRIRQMGERFSHVKLSVFVADRETMQLSSRIGGECVATEV